mgnify:CR=1 FL=1
MEKKPARAIALLPIGVFLVLYLGLGIVFEYVLKIEMGFYNIPIVVAFLAAILVACLQNRALSFDEKLEVMAKGVGDKSIMTMILIFLAAGVFVGVVGRSSAESVAYFMLAHIPARFAVAVLFVVSCFVSTAMGTSCGTITLIVPIAVAVARTSGFSLPLCIGSVMGGAMFGDNLSFISDTTIAACNGQGCAMKDKFRENFHIALPAALATLVLILVLTLNADVIPAEIPGYHLIQIIPYVLVLVGGIIGINVFVVLLIGIVSGSVIVLADAQRQGIAACRGNGDGDGRDERDGADARAHGGGDEAADDEQHRHGKPGRDDREHEIRHALRARAAHHADEDTGGKEDEQHRHDVLIADALSHQRELVVKAQRAVLAARRQQRDKKDDYNRDGIKAHRDLEHILKDKSQPQVKEQELKDRQQRCGIGFLLHSDFFLPDFLSRILNTPVCENGGSLRPAEALAARAELKMVFDDAEVHMAVAAAPALRPNGIVRQEREAEALLVHRRGREQRRLEAAAEPLGQRAVGAVHLAHRTALVRLALLGPIAERDHTHEPLIRCEHIAPARDRF